MFRLILPNNSFFANWFPQHWSHLSSLNEHLCLTLVRPAVQSWYISNNFNQSQWLTTNSVEVVFHAGINIYKIIYHAACGRYRTDLFTDNVPYITGTTELSLNRIVVFTAFGGFKSSKVRSERKFNRLIGSGSGLQYAFYPWSAVCICNPPLPPPPPPSFCSL